MSNEISEALERADAFVQALRDRGAAEQPSAPRARGRYIVSPGPTSDFRARLPLWLHKKLEERAAARLMAKSAYVCELVLRDLGIDEELR